MSRPLAPATVEDAAAGPAPASTLPGPGEGGRLLAADAWLLAALAALGLAAAGLVLLLTRTTPGLTPPDAPAYLATADHLRAGRGYTTPFDTLFDAYTPADAVGARGEIPLAHWSPGLPTLLAAGSYAFGSGLRAARFLNAGFLALAVVLGGWIVHRIRPSWPRALGAAAVLAFLPSMLSLYGLVLADGMLVTAMLATVLAARAAVLRPVFWRFVVVGVLGLAAVSAKYAGAAVAVAAGVAVAAVVPRSARQRAAMFAAAAGPGIALAVLWSQRGDARGFVSHLPNRLDLTTLGATVGGWFSSGVPSTARALAILVAAGLVGVATWTAFGRGLPPDRRVLTTALGLSGTLVAVAVVFARSFADALVAFNYRQLLPLQVAVVLLVAAAPLPARREIRVAAAVVLALVALLAVWPWASRDGWRFAAITGHTTTVGAVSAGFPRIPALSASGVVRTLPPGALIVSDFPENVWLQTGRTAIQLPGRRDITADADNPRLDAELVELASVTARGGYLVRYQCPGDGDVFPTNAYLERFLTFTPVFVDERSCVLRLG